MHYYCGRGSGYYYTNMNGESIDSSVVKNKEVKTKNYDNPVAWILNNEGKTVLESVTAKIYNKSIAW